MADLLGPLLSPRYFVAVEERSYVEELSTAQLITVPDVSVLGTYTAQPVAVRQPATNVAEPEIVELAMPEPIRETYLSIQEVGETDIAIEMWLEEDGLKVVTILEILSPWNKSAREGRAHYSRKRNAVFNSYTNLVEIDLLRSGLGFTQTKRKDYHYSILVSEASMRPPCSLLSVYGTPADSNFSLAFTRGR